ncbi:hypothetical protein [Allohahella sp. A8]|uniref:hypothetical protein n=1 Tax=Allohahella sp. A8 TaxID=3141461 RepID=UPI003A80628D
MIRDSRQQDQIILEGGLDFETPGASLTPGRMIACQNYVLGLNQGYSSMPGYERHDGRPEPHKRSGDLAIDRRNAIQPVPGSGPVRGVHVHNGYLFAIRNTEDGSAAKLWRAVSNGWQDFTGTNLPLLPNGRAQFVSYNFAANPFGVMVFVDGVNKAKLLRFISESQSYLEEITLPGDATPPVAVAANNNILYLATERGSLYYSAVGDPRNFDPVGGLAGEIAVGGKVTGLYPLVGGALCIQMQNQISVLYGSSEADLQKKDLRLHDDKSGAIAFSSLSYNDLYFLGDRGITSLSATQSFGSFQSGAFSKGITPFIQSRKPYFTCAVAALDRNQLRWAFNSPATQLQGSEVITATFSGNKLAGFTRQVLGFKATCAASGEMRTGEPAVFMGSTDGWVYRMDVGTSFDGLPIQAYFMTAFANSRQPGRKKAFKQATINVQSDGPVPIKAKPVFDFGASDVMAHRVEAIDVIGGATNFDEANWDSFTWSAPHLNEAHVEIRGRGQNLAMLISSTSADAKPHSISDILVTYTLGGLRL